MPLRVDLQQQQHTQHPPVNDHSWFCQKQALLFSLGANQV
jgi:hypothetical protein